MPPFLMRLLIILCLAFALPAAAQNAGGIPVDPAQVGGAVADDAAPFVEDEPVVIIDTGFMGDDPYFRSQVQDHALRVLEWQLKTSQTILVMVMLLTAAGVLFAGYQLWHAMQMQARADKDGAAADTDTTLSLGGGRLSVSSPVVGISILVISLGALYLFLTFVYRIDVMTLPV